MWARALAAASGELEVVVELPGGDLTPVVAPLQRLGLEESLGQGIAQGIEDDVVAAEGLDRILEAVGEQADVAPLQLGGVEAVQRLLHRWRHGPPPLPANEPAPERH